MLVTQFFEYNHVMCTQHTVRRDDEILWSRCMYRETYAGVRECIYRRAHAYMMITIDCQRAADNTERGFI